MIRRLQYFASIFLLLGVLFVPFAVPAAQAETTDTTTPPVFTPEIPIPGLFTTHAQDGSLLASYIQAVYIYFVWIVGVLAVIMIVWGAVRWIGAAGNAGQIKSAREIITNAVVGLIIALTSVVILNTINPDLTKLSILDIGHVLPVKLGTYDPDGKCFPNIQCPDDMTQVQGNTCPGLMTAFVYVNPGDIACGSTADSSAKSICCQSKTDAKVCIGVSSKDGGKTGKMTCSKVAPLQAKATGCTDTTACGVVKSLSATSKCIGHVCPTNTLCVIASVGQPGACLPKSDSTSFTLLRSCEDWTTDQIKSSTTLRFDSDVDCGKMDQVTTPTGTVSVAGVRSSCPAGQYCALATNPKYNGEQCVVIGAATICQPDEKAPNTQ